MSFTFFEAVSHPRFHGLNPVFPSVFSRAFRLPLLVSFVQPITSHTLLSTHYERQCPWSKVGCVADIASYTFGCVSARTTFQ